MADPNLPYSHHDRTNRAFFETVASADAPAPLDVMDKLLSRAHSRLLNTLNWFSPPSASTKAALASGSIQWRGATTKIPKPLSSFVTKISTLLNLEEPKAHALFHCYLSAHLGKEHLSFNDSTLLEVTDFYYDERRCLLSALCALLRNGEDESHPYHSVSSAALSRLVKDGLHEKIASLYSELAKARPPKHLSPQHAIRWSDANIAEQCSLLEVQFFLYYGRLSTSADQFLKMASSFAATGFGSRQLNATYMSEAGRASTERLSHLQQLLLVELLSLESLAPSAHDTSESLPITTHPLINDLPKIHSLLSTWTTLPHHGPVLLGWTSLLSCAATAVDQGLLPPSVLPVPQEAIHGEYKRMGSAALNLDVFAALLALSRSDTLAADEPSVTGFKSVLKGLLGSVLSAFHVGLLPGYETIVDFAFELFHHQPGLTQQYWTQDVHHDPLRSLLDMARSRFPASIPPFAKLLTALASSHDGARVVFTYIHQLPTYTAALSSLSPINPASPHYTPSSSAPAGSSSPSVPTGDILRLLDDVSEPPPPGATSGPQHFRLREAVWTAEGVQLPAGTVGRVLTSPEDPAPVIQWKASYSGWSVVYGRIDAALRVLMTPSSSVPSHVLNAAFSDLSALYSLLHSIFRQDPSLILALPSIPSPPPSPTPTPVNVLDGAARVGSARAFEGSMPLTPSASLPAAPSTWDLSPTSSRPSSDHWLLSSTFELIHALSTLPQQRSPTSPALATLANALYVAGDWARVNPDHVWTLFRSYSLIPGFHPDEGPSSGSLRRILRTVEVPAGEYPVTIALLDLISILASFAQRLPSHGPAGPGGVKASPGKRSNDSHNPENKRQRTTPPTTPMQAVSLGPSTAGTAPSMAGQGSGPSSSAWEPGFIPTSVRDFQVCIAYVRAEIFSSHEGWRYVHISDRWRIGIKALNIFRIVLIDAGSPPGSLPDPFLSDPTEQDPQKDANQQHMSSLDLSRRSSLISFLADHSLHRAVLNVIGIGSATLEKLFARRAPSESRTFETLVVLALGLVERLLELRATTAPDAAPSLLESAILSRSVGKAGTKSLVLVLAGFIAYPYNPHIPLYSTRVLALLCRLSSSIQPRPPSLVGYFGAAAPYLRSHFMARLSSPREKEPIRLAILDLINAALHSQLGLAELFLKLPQDMGAETPKSGDNKSDKENGATSASIPTSELDKDSCIHSILKILGEAPDFLKIYPRLLCETLHLLYTVWQLVPDRRLIRWLRRRPRFWSDLTSILTLSMEHGGSSASDPSANGAGAPLGPLSSPSAAFEALAAASAALNTPPPTTPQGGETAGTATHEFTPIDDRSLDSYRLLARSWVLGILSLEVYQAPLARNLDPGLMTVLAKFVKDKWHIRWFKDFTACSWSPELVDAVSSQSKALGVDLAEYHRSPHAAHGEGFIYNAVSLAHRLGVNQFSFLSVWRDIVQSAGGTPGGSSSPLGPMIQSSPPRERKEAQAARLVGLVFELNLCYSLVDSQAILLRSWKAFLEILVMRAAHAGQIRGSKPALGIAESATAAASDVGVFFSLDETQPWAMLKGLMEVMNEERRDGYMISVRLTEVSGLLLALLERWSCGVPPQSSGTSSGSAPSSTMATPATPRGKPPLGISGGDPFSSPSNGSSVPGWQLTQQQTVELITKYHVFLETFVGMKNPPTGLVDNVLAIGMVLFSHMEAIGAPGRPGPPASSSGAGSPPAPHLKSPRRPSGLDPAQIAWLETLRGLLPLLCSVMETQGNSPLAMGVLTAAIRLSPQPGLFLPLLRGRGIVELLLRAVTESVSSALAMANANVESETPEALRHSPAMSASARLVESALSFCLSLASDPQGAQLLASAGLGPRLTTLSLTLANGEGLFAMSQPYLMYGGSAVAPMEHVSNEGRSSVSTVNGDGDVNAWHQVWVQLLATFTAQLCSLGHVEGWVDQTLEFVGVHADRLHHALTHVSVFGPPSRSSPEDEGTGTHGFVTLGGLREAAAVTGLFSALAQHSEPWRWVMGEHQFGTQDAAVRLVHHYTLLLVQPSALARITRAVTRAEKKTAALHPPQPPAGASSSSSGRASKTTSPPGSTGFGAAEPKRGGVPPLAIPGSSSSGSSESTSLENVAKRSLSALDSPLATAPGSPARGSDMEHKIGDDVKKVKEESRVTSSPRHLRVSPSPDRARSGSVSPRRLSIGPSSRRGSVSGEAPSLPGDDLGPRRAWSGARSTGSVLEGVPFATQVEVGMYRIIRNVVVTLHRIQTASAAGIGPENSLIFSPHLKLNPGEAPSLGMLLSLLNHGLFAVKKTLLVDRAASERLRVVHSDIRRVLNLVLEVTIAMAVSHAGAYMALPPTHPAAMEVREDVCNELDAFLSRMVKHQRSASDGDSQFWSAIQTHVREWMRAAHPHLDPAIMGRAGSQQSSRGTPRGGTPMRSGRSPRSTRSTRSVSVSSGRGY